MSKNKYNNPICDNKMSFEECELALLRLAVDENENQQKLIKQQNINNPELKTIFSLLESFIKQKRLILYGGFAINAILPKYAQFYNKNVDIPDYDIYSPTPLDDAIELSNFFYKKGYKEVEAKSGVHFGTYKVYVNFIPIADITHLEKEIFNNIQKDAIKINGILFSPANFLRMNMYLELSRPLGDVSRWEKVLKRLNKLNQFYPVIVNEDCNTVDFQRKMDSNAKEGEQIYVIVRDAFIFMGAIFFGGFASSLYSKYMPLQEKKLVEKIPDFDVLYENAEKGAIMVKEKLFENGFKNVTITKHEQLGEIIPLHYEIKYNKEIIAFVYEPIACHSYNTITLHEQQINVATIDTMLSFYFAFYYSNKPYYYRDRILCMVKFLFDVEEKNRLEQKGLLKRFTISCIGKQKTLDDIRSEKTEKFKKLMYDKNSREYMMWFLKYNPSNKGLYNVSKHQERKNINNKTNKKRKNYGLNDLIKTKMTNNNRKRRTKKGYKLW